jgi:ribonuclease BN (tRNA processing enzyme)
MTFKITVIGSGNAFNTNGRGAPAFLVENEHCRFLLDCGPNILLKAEMHRIDLRGLDAVFLTHFHGDHAVGIPFLLIFMKYIERRKEPFTIIGPEGLKEWVNYSVELCYPEITFPFIVYYDELRKNEKTSMFYMDIECVPIEHKDESIGYRFGYSNRTIAFSGDSKWHPSLKRLTDSTDLAFVECSSIKKLDADHVSVDDLQNSAENYLEKSKKTVLIHVYNKIEEEIKKRGLKYEVSYDGQVFTL